jgi:ubiquinone/menaquinone biosynthesis C-methylase UbiE
MNLNLDIRHISIIDALPIHEALNEVLTVGCGSCKIELWLIQNGFDVTSSDFLEEASKFNFDEQRKLIGSHEIEIINSNILDIETFPKKSYESVICSEVLEHLPDYTLALKNLLSLAQKRLILTVPWKRSFDDTSPPPKGHCNYWNDVVSGVFKDINEFIDLCKPHAVSIQKIRTKPKDVSMRQYDYLIIVDKKQKWNQ